MKRTSHMAKEGKTGVDSDRYQRGVAVLQQIGGENFDNPVDELQDIAPDLGRFAVEFVFGDVLRRRGLDLKSRQLCAVAALAAMGTAQPQLRFDINGARNVGATPEEVVEVIILAAVYAGFPAALNGISAARDVFGQRGDVPRVANRLEGRLPGEDRFARGMTVLDRTSRGAGAAVVESLRDIAPDLGRFVVEFSYGDVIGRPTLDEKTTELAAVAMCTALGRDHPQLAVHIDAALNVGASREEVVEVIQQMAAYAGFPAALNGISVARKVFGSH